MFAPNSLLFAIKITGRLQLCSSPGYFVVQSDIIMS